jgi:tripartite-type tricarboxylate transporter receptor subunit TctC
MPVRNVGEFVVLARKRGPDLVGGSNGTGTTSHLALEMLNQIAKLKLMHVPYKGGVPSMTALVGGEVDFGFTTVLTIQPFIKLGKVRPLAITHSRRSSAIPGLPTVAEAAQLPGYELLGLFGVFGPAGLPADIVQKLHAAIQTAAQDPSVLARMTTLSLDVRTSTPEELALRMRQDAERWGKVAKEVGIQPQ